jgi:hypothetical protein
MLNLCDVLVTILKMATSRNFSIDSWHWKISAGHHFQNGHHNTAQIQHCSISTTFHMWVDYDVLIWFLTLKNFYNRTMLNLCGIVAAILKMATGRNCSMSAINSGHHYLSTYQILMISVPKYGIKNGRKNSTLTDIIKIWYVDR